MHVIAKTALVAFWNQYPDAEPPLRVWYHLMEKRVFKDFSELRVTFGSADYVDGLTVFDIGLELEKLSRAAICDFSNIAADQSSQKSLKRLLDSSV